VISAITWCRNRYPTYELVLEHCCDTITPFCHITLIVTESCVTENLRTQQLGNRTYCPSLSSDRSSRPYLGPSGSHNSSDMAVQTPKILHGHITSHSYVVILTTSLSWYLRDTKSEPCHAPRDVSDNSDVPRGSAVTTRPNSDSQRHARSDSVRNRVPKEHAHPKYASLDRARVKLRFTRSRASEISFRDTSACSETARRVRTRLRAPRA